MAFFYIQATTALILILAANTAFNGFPLLSSILAQDRYLPRQLHTRGDRLAFSNGIIVLAVVAAALIYAFDGSVTRLIQLYILGVFTSFTLCQTGMVRHWNRALAVERDPVARRRIHRSRLINAVGAGLTGLVLVIVLVDQVHPRRLPGRDRDAAAVRDDARHPPPLRPGQRGAGARAPADSCCPARIHAVVLVSRLHRPTLRALAFARASRPDTLTALTVQPRPRRFRRCSNAGTSAAFRCR